LPQIFRRRKLEMGTKMEQYVEERDGGYYVAGTRISLDSVVHPFKNGASPESILRSFPLIGSLEKVYGAITFYLAHKDDVDAYLCEQERLSQQLAAAQPPLADSLAKKLHRAREEALLR
jgi:uncharacterized protein (DUF433 family)